MLARGEEEVHDLVVFPGKGCLAQIVSITEVRLASLSLSLALEGRAVSLTSRSALGRSVRPRSTSARHCTPDGRPGRVALASADSLARAKMKRRRTERRRASILGECSSWRLAMVLRSAGYDQHPPPPHSSLFSLPFRSLACSEAEEGLTLPHSPFWSTAGHRV